MTRKQVLWVIPMQELTLMHWADYERATGKPVRWQPNIFDRVDEILKGGTDGDTEN